MADRMFVLSRNTIPEDAFTGDITENAAPACLPSQTVTTDDDDDDDDDDDGGERSVVPTLVKVGPSSCLQKGQQKAGGLRAMSL